MFIASVVGLGLLSGLDTPPAYADFTFGEPVNLKSIIPVFDPAHYRINCFSYDGLEMYISSNRPEGYGDWDICVLTRASKDDDWSPPVNLGPGVNSPQQDSFSSISADGLTLYFNSDRPGGYGSFFDIYTTTRATKDSPWGPAMNTGPMVNSSDSDTNPWISADGLELYFGSFRPGGYGLQDFYVTRRATENEPWGTPVNLGPVVNSAYDEEWVSLSPDGRLLFFCDHPSTTVPRPGGYGGADMWMARRESSSDAWQAPINLGPVVNGPTIEVRPRISPDGCTFYFNTALTPDASTWDCWSADHPHRRLQRRRPS